MIKSMTAFAYTERSHQQGHLIWEIRSVNHRYLDISLHLPEAFQSQENKLRTLIKNHVRRGKVNASLRYMAGEPIVNEIQINKPLARALIIAYKQVTLLSKDVAPLRAVDILQWPGVTQNDQPNFKKLQQQAFESLTIGLNDLIATRGREGERLAEFIYQRCDQIAEIVMQVRKRRKIVVKSLRRKFHQRLQKLQLEVDNNRLEQEIVFYAHKLDVAEELDRIMAHLDEVTAVLERQDPVGRRLDFLMQEFNREANTLASKSHDSETTQYAVDLKVLIEQLREQIQNIE